MYVVEGNDSMFSRRVTLTDKAERQVASKKTGICVKPSSFGVQHVFRIIVDTAVSLGFLPRPKSTLPGTPERFLIISLAGHLGDTVMLLPMIEALRRTHPSARIECAVESAAVPL